MLTRELAIAEYNSGQIVPDRLTQQKHAHYRGLADQMLALYRDGAGKTRRDLHQSVQAIFKDELDCPVRRIDAFCKLLDEKSTYDRDRGGQAAKLRQQVFRMAGKKHPLVQQPDRLFETSELEVKQEIAKELDKTWWEIERELFADVIQFHRLASFEGYAGSLELLSRYNVAQCQAVLYDAVSMTVWAGEDFKSILRYAKLARLMHTIERVSDSEYRFQFDGPSSILRQSRRYGVAMAKFLPALLACRDWKMQAVITHRRSYWKNYFRLSPADGLKSNLPAPDDFDSSWEEKFVKSWGSQRNGWRLIREGEVLCQNQKVFVPDFLFQHESGTRVMLELVGFWTPEYLTAKLETLKTFRKHPILLAVSQSSGWSEKEEVQDQLKEFACETFFFKTSLRVKDVLERLQKRLC